jgi:hypothetical protein
MNTQFPCLPNPTLGVNLKAATFRVTHTHKNKQTLLRCGDKGKTRDQNLLSDSFLLCGLRKAAILSENREQPLPSF